MLRVDVKKSAEVSITCSIDPPDRIVVKMNPEREVDCAGDAAFAIFACSPTNGTVPVWGDEDPQDARIGVCCTRESLAEFAHMLLKMLKETAP